jgi:ABC-type Fe3+/spermidine/putrescine transport system ATPase subunit
MDLYCRPNCSEVADFFGSVNWLAGALVGSDLVETRIGRLKVCGQGHSGPDVVVGFRPESLQIAVQEDDSRENIFEVDLRSSIFLGDQFVYETTVDDLLIIGKSRVPPTCGGRRLRVYVDSSDIMVFPRAGSVGLGLSDERR